MVAVREGAVIKALADAIHQYLQAELEPLKNQLAGLTTKVNRLQLGLSPADLDRLATLIVKRLEATGLPAAPGGSTEQPTDAPPT